MSVIMSGCDLVAVVGGVHDAAVDPRKGPSSIGLCHGLVDKFLDPFHYIRRTREHILFSAVWKRR